MSQIVLFSDGTVKESFAGDRVENWIQLFARRTDPEHKKHVSHRNISVAIVKFPV